MPLNRKRLSLAGLAACAGALALAPASHAATTFGSRLIQDPNTAPCQDSSPGAIDGPCTMASYIVPTDPNGDPSSQGAAISGVITKFRIRAFGTAIGMDPTASPAQVTFRLVNITVDPSGDSAIATSAGTGPTVTVPADDDGADIPITQVGARLPVAQGQHLAIDASPNLEAIYASSGDKDTYLFAPPLVDGEGGRGSTEVNEELLVQADIEPDADHDGFGDETQDQCPTQATTQGPCDSAAPAVSGLRVSGGKLSYTLSEAATVRFGLAKASTGRRVGRKCVRRTRRNSKRRHCTRFTTVGRAFAGPGAAGPNSLTLPKIRGRKLGAGRYRLTMTVTDAAGNSATTTKSFTIKAKPKHKKHKHHR
jgi:hypothetical protein